MFSKDLKILSIKHFSLVYNGIFNTFWVFYIIKYSFLNIPISAGIISFKNKLRAIFKYTLDRSNLFPIITHRSMSLFCRQRAGCRRFGIVFLSGRGFFHIYILLYFKYMPSFYDQECPYTAAAIRSRTISPIIWAGILSVDRERLIM